MALHCIGGFAMTMQYGLSRETHDIDVLPASGKERLTELQQVAGEGSELHRRFKVYVQVVAIASSPEDYESRLIRIWPDFKLERLSLYSLEAHDLALTKLERNWEVDRRDVQALARADRLNPQATRGVREVSRPAGVTIGLGGPG